MTTDLSEFKQYSKLADFLIDEASKEELAECARLLAINVAHYEGKFGEIPLEETLATLEVTEPNEEQVALLRDGMVILVALLGTTIGGMGEEKH